MSLKDRAICSYNENPERRADLFNGTVFHGKQVIEAACLKFSPRKKAIFYMNAENMEEIAEDKCDGKETHTGEKIKTPTLNFLERERDGLSLHDHPERKCYLSCEYQSRADYTMPAREFLEDGIEYVNQLNAQENKGKTVDGRTVPLIPVFHLTLYTGEERWLSKHRLQEMMDISDEMKEFQELLPEYHTYVFDIHEQNPEKFHTEWREVFRLMHFSRKKEELKLYMEMHREELEKLSLDTRILLASLLDETTVLMNRKKGKVTEVCSAWDGAMQMYKDEGRQEGRQEGREEGREEGAVGTENNFLKLLKCLCDDGRMGEIAEFVEDRSRMVQLFQEYGIQRISCS